MADEDNAKLAGISVFEWRLLSLERDNDDKETRLRTVEGEIAQLNEKLKVLPSMDDSIKKLLDDRYKNLVGFVVVIVSVVLSFVFSHLQGVHP